MFWTHRSISFTARHEVLQAQNPPNGRHSGGHSAALCAPLGLFLLLAQLLLLALCLALARLQQGAELWLSSKCVH